MPTENTNDPFLVLSRPIDAAGQQRGSVIWDAVGKFDAKYPGPLLRLIRSDNYMVVRQGLMVFAEVGKSGYVILDDVIEAAKNIDEFGKADVLDAMLSYPTRLTQSHVEFIVSLADQSFPLIRLRLMHLIELVHTSLIRIAFGTIEVEDVRESHERGLSLFVDSNTDFNFLLDRYRSADQIGSLYIGARIFSASRNGTPLNLEACEADTNELEHIFFNCEKLYRRGNKR